MNNNSNNNNVFNLQNIDLKVNDRGLHCGYQINITSPDRLKKNTGEFEGRERDRRKNRH